MTVEEIEIIVTAQVEEALKEFQKFLPAIKQTMKQAQEAFSKVDTRVMTNKLQQTVNLTKKKMQNLKKSSENNEIAIKINNKEAKKQITQLEKEINSLQAKINASQTALKSINIKVDNIKEDTSLEERLKMAARTGYKNNYTMQEYSTLDNNIDKALNENSNYTYTIKQQEILKKNIEEYKLQIDTAKKKLIELSQVAVPKRTITGARTMNVEEPNISAWNALENKIGEVKLAMQAVKQCFKNVFSGEAFKQEDPFNLGESGNQVRLIELKIDKLEAKIKGAQKGKIKLNDEDIAKAEVELDRLYNQKEKVEKTSGGKFFSRLFSETEKTKTAMEKMSKILINIRNQINKMSSGFKNGLGHVLKYAMALLSLRGIYSVLSSCAQSWLSSQNAGAKQLSANINYMKYAMGSALAPTIQFVTNLVYQLMKAIQSVAYALTRVNIFAKASASSYASMAESAKKAKNETKSLSNIHSEINNVQSNNNSDSESLSPSFDLSGIDNQMSPLAQKLYDFFKPLVDSWNQHGAQVIEALKNAISGIGQAISAMWSSVETLFTNGTIYSIIGNILNSIGQIGTAWANAWNNGNNGTEIIQGIANMIDDITNAILNLVSSTGFQSFLDGVLSAFSGIVQFIEPIVSGFSEMAEKILEIVFSTIGEVLKTVGDALQTIAQNEIAVEVLKAVGEAIAIVVGAIILWNAVQAILNGLMGLFSILTSPITLIILAIIVAITAIILVVKNWGAISEWFQDLWIKITEKLQEVWNNIKTFFVNLWNSIIDKIKAVWNGVKDFFSNIWNGIKTVAITIWDAIKGTISNVINGIKNTISNVLNGIKNIWNNVWNGLKTTVTNIFNGIWNTIKRIINSILGGIEGMANGVVRGVNAVIRTLNKLKFDIPDWVPGVGGKTFGFNIGLMSEVSLPRLAKGNVAYDKTLAVFGEYAGASNNPEITTPQNIMRETFEDVLSNYNNENSDRPINLTVNVGSTKLGQILLDNLRDMKRQSGKDIEALVGG